MEGAVEPLLERGIHLVDHLENALELEPGADGLQAVEGILLVDHDREGLPAVHDHGGTDTLGGMLAGDEMTLDEHLLFQRGEVLRIDGKGIAHFREGLDLGLDRFEDLQALMLFRPTGKGEILDVAREAHAAADDDLVVRDFAPHPFTGAIEDIVNGHGATPRRGAGSGRAGWRRTRNPPGTRLSSSHVARS